MSRLVIKNNNITLDNNIKKLIISNKKILVKEAIEDISLENASAILTDTVKSTVKISEGILKNFLTNTKFMISISLLPLTQNLDSVVKSYESDISASNKLFLESIPQNVANTSNILSIPATTPTAIYQKFSEEFEKVEGIKEIINSKFFSSLDIIGTIKKLLEGTFDFQKDVTGVILKTVLKDLPQYLAGESSLYGTNENKELQNLLEKIYGRGSSYDEEEGISGFKIKKNQLAEDFALKIANSIRTTTGTHYGKGIVEDAFTNNIPEAAAIVNCIFHLIEYTQSSKFKWDTNLAIPPLNNTNIVRFKYSNYNITIKKTSTPITSEDQLKNCYLAIDKNNEQATEDLDFYSLFI